MNWLNSLPFKLLLGILLALGLMTDMVQGQVIQPRQELPPPLGTPHHVVGRVEKGTCPSSLNGATLQVAEFWYTLTGTGDRTLVIPAHPTNGILDPLSFTGRTLEQGRVLGNVTLTGDATAFDVQWLEVPLSTRFP